MSESEDPVVVYTSQGPLGAEVAKSLLESQGIPAMLRYSSIGRVLGLTIDGLGKCDVLVPPSFEQLAREALRDLPDTSGGQALEQTPH